MMSKINKQEVYDYLRTIPKGKVVTYGMIARHLGSIRWARAVGSILHVNPDGEKYPCYKVVTADGKLSKSYAFGGIDRQKALLQRDGIKVNGDKVDTNLYRWQE